MSRFLLLVCAFGLLVGVFAKPHSETRSREEVEHFADDPSRHDVNFDHAAFLGSETAKEYSKLTPEQSREKLKEIIRKIDKDADGKVTEKEMKEWIAYVAKVGQQQVTEKRWSEVNQQGLNPLPWEVYVEASYGKEEDRLKDVETVDAYRKVVKQDKRRWDAADLDKDNALTKDEFADFLNPEDKAHMRDAVIDELLEAVDTDRNGQVSESEYLDDLARAYQTPLVDGEPEPDWVAREREQYQKYRDIDHNGFMDRTEVGEWVMPTGYDPVEAETQHLFYHADIDKVETDKKLSG
ncbi:hypothetical protein CRM22_002612 [Opisthorchis felineus]|uniref:Reticulocalbin-3 n=1 Tax=Opisthorchis felineus TaxID=147828 RepID=A0A4V3SG98_OPIFE|nr:hypothetical protein CRM22_002612 [Opisthorchis felineus]